jgi:2,3-bisphosphoglycerate-independent phosphoglycerate mutase
MADEPVPALGNKTPMQYAFKPGMDRLAAMGCSGLLSTVPAGMSPGSEVANLSVLGYDPEKTLEGRGVLEAASMGIEVENDEIAMRCNLICIENGLIKNHSAGHISTDEATELIEFLNNAIGSDCIKFFPGVSYRHVLKIRGGNKQLDCIPPHDVMGTDFRSVLIRPKSKDAVATAEQLNALIFKSQSVLENHPINLRRQADGKDPANSIWPWSPGSKPRMKPFAKMFPVASGAVISAVDLIRGIGVCAGLHVLDVEGTTGLYDTNYEGKAQAAIDALATHDFVYLHIEAPDEAGHEGDPLLKVRTIEDIDRRVVQPVITACAGLQQPIAITLLPDHPTPCAIKTHTSEPVPFTFYKPTVPPDQVQRFDEFEAAKGAFPLLKGDEFMKMLLS